jgi:uncharacterized protein YukE
MTTPADLTAVAANYPAFDAAADNFASAYGRFQGSVEDLAKQVASLTAGNSGAYAQAMNVDMANVQKGLGEMGAIINNITQMIPAAKEAYIAADAAASKFFA